MRNLLFILILANVLYFLWSMLDGNGDEPGVAVIDAEDLGPPLPAPEAVPANDEDREGRSDTVPTVESESDLVGVVGRACVSIGPFEARDEANDARSRYAGERMRAAIREGEGGYFVGHWVQIPDIPDAAESERMLDILHEAGLTDAYPVQTEEEGRKISLGLFGNLDSAKRIEAQAQALGLPAVIRARMTEPDEFWVDIELPPGRGAGEIVERYGEERVLLRDAATCP